MKSWIKRLIPFKTKSEEQELSEEFTVRSKALDITNRLFADFRARYYGDSTPRNNGSRPPEDWQYDGLIETSIGFYRPFVDVRNGNVVLLNAYNVSSLVPKQNQDGQWRLDEERGVYVVDVLKGNQEPVDRANVKCLGAKGPDLRRIMLNHHNEIRDANYNHLNLYTADITNLVKQKDPENPKRIIKMTNGELAYGIFEMSNGEWMVRLYVANEKLETHDIDRFMHIEERAPEGFLGRTLSLGQGNDRFASLREAKQFVFKDWAQFTDEQKNSRAYRLWQGQSPLRPADKRRYPLDHMLRYTRVTARTIDKFKSHRPVIAAALVAGSQAVPALRTGRVLATGIAAVSAATMALVDMCFEEGLLKLWNKADRWKTKLMAKIFKKIADEELPHTYMVDTAQNLNRWCPKVNPEVLQHLRPLSQTEANMQYDNAPCCGYESINDFDHWIATLQNRFYASVFRPLNQNMVTAKAPNGLVGLFHLSGDGRTRTSYISYNPDANVGSAILIPSQNLERLKAGQVFKTVHRKGEPVKAAEALSMQDFFAQAHILATHEGHGHHDKIQQDMIHVHCLFNNLCILDDHAEKPKQTKSTTPQTVQTKKQRESMPPSLPVEAGQTAFMALI